MAIKKQTLVIAIKGDFDNLDKQVAVTEKALKDMGLTATSMVSSVNVAGNKTRTVFKAVAEEVKNVEKVTADLQKEIDKAGLKNSRIQKTTIQNNKTAATIAKEEAKAIADLSKKRERARIRSFNAGAKDQAERSARAARENKKILAAEKVLTNNRKVQAKERTLNAVRAAKDTARLTTLEISKGLNSLEHIRETFRQKQITAEFDLQKTISKIDKRFVAGRLTGNAAAGGRRRASNAFLSESAKIAQQQKDAEDSLRKQKALEDSIAASLRKSNGLRSNSVNRQKDLNVATRTTKASVHSLIDANKSVLRHITDIVIGYRAVNFAINSILAGLRAIPQAGINFQQTRLGLAGILGTEGANKELEAISELADKSGQSLVGLEKGYVAFASSALLAGATQKEVNQVFEDFVVVATVLKKSEDQLTSIFLALEQIFSKGVVQSEEVKKQLGNQIPAAVELFALAVGKTPAAFLKAMEANEIIAKEAVPKLSALLREIFGGVDDRVFEKATKQFSAVLGRIQNRFEQLNRGVFSKFADTATIGLNILSDSIKTLTDNLDGLFIILKTISIFIVARFATALKIVTLGYIKNSLAALKATKQMSNFQKLGLASGTKKLGVFGKGVKTLTTGLGGLSLAFLGVSGVVSGTIIGIGLLAGLLLKASGASIGYGRATNILTEDVKEQAKSLTNNAKEQEKLINKYLEVELASKGLTVTLENQVITLAQFGEAILSLFVKSVEEIFGTGPDNVFIKAEKQLTEFITNTTAKIIAFSRTPKIQGAIEGVFSVEGVDTAFQKNFRIAKKELQSIAAKNAAEEQKLLQEAKDNTSTGSGNSFTSAIVDEVAKNNKPKSFNKLKALQEQLKEVSRVRELLNRNALEDIPEKGAKAKNISGISTASTELTFQYARALEDVAKQLNNLRGIEGGAAEEERRTKLAERTVIFAKKQDQAAIGRALEASRLQGIQDGVNIKLKESIKLRSELAAKEAINNLETRSGIKTTIEGLLEEDRLRQQKIARLQEVLRDIKAANKEAGASSLQNKNTAQQAQQELDKLQAAGSSLDNIIREDLTNSLDDAFLGFIDGSKTAAESMESFANSVVASLAKVASKTAAESLLKGFTTKNITSGLSSAFTAVKGLGSSALSSLTSLFAADGAAFTPKGKITEFATGGVISTPTAFGFSGGLGVLGEAGPEAILPLEKGKDGKLGVTSSGTTSKNLSIGNITINVVSPEDTDANKQAELIARTVRGQLKQLIGTEIGSATRQGNQLNPTQIVGAF